MAEQIPTSMGVDWRSETFRRKVITQIDEAVRLAATPMTKSSAEMENHVYLKAKTREEYLALVARLILHVKGITAQHRRSTTASLNKTKSAVVAALKVVHFAAVNSLNDSMVPRLNRLCIAQGVLQLNDLHVTDHTSHLNHKSIQNLQQAMAQVLEINLLGRVRESGFYSLTLHEATESSASLNVVVNIRYLVKGSSTVESRTELLGLLNMTNTASPTNADELLNFLQCKGLDLDKLVCVSVDGGAELTGCKAIMVAQLKERKPGLLSTHCIAHMLVLCCDKAMSKIRYMVKYMQVLNSLFTHIENTPLLMSAVARIQTVLQSDRTAGKEDCTSWLTVKGSLQAVVDDYSSLVTALIQNNTAKSLTLVKSITTFKFLYVTHCLADVLPYVIALCKAYESSEISMDVIESLLQSTVEIIEGYEQSRSGQNLVTFLGVAPVIAQQDNTRTLFFDFGGHAVRDGVSQRAEAESACRQFLIGLSTDLRSRYTDENDVITVSGLTGMFDPALLQSNVDGLVQAAEIVVKYLMKCGMATEVDARNAVDLFFSQLKSLCTIQKDRFHSVRDVAEFAILHGTDYPLICMAAKHLLLIMSSSVDCQRVFMKQRLIESYPEYHDHNIKTKENLLRISAHEFSVDEKYYDMAYDMWQTLIKQ